MADISGHRAGRERDFVRSADDSAGNRFLDASVSLLVVQHARDDGLIDAQLLGDGLHATVTEPVLSFVPREDYRCGVSHELTGVGLRQSIYDGHSASQATTSTFFDANSQMPVDKGLAARMFQAQHHREGQLGHKLVLREIGEAVARAAGLDEPVAPSVVRRWLIAQQEPRGLAVWRALAAALGVDPGWLAFGDASAAPMAGKGATTSPAPDAHLRKSERELAERILAGPKKTKKRGRSR